LLWQVLIWKIPLEFSRFKNLKWLIPALRIEATAFGEVSIEPKLIAKSLTFILNLFQDKGNAQIHIGQIATVVPPSQ